MRLRRTRRRIRQRVRALVWGLRANISDLSVLLSRSAIQSRGECPYHEAELVQDHRFEQVSGGHTVPAEGTRLEGW